MYLTGGHGDDSRLVSIYSVEENAWKDGECLNHPRYQHASICLGERVFVIGGLFAESCIESVYAESRQSWSIIEPSGLKD